MSRRNRLIVTVPSIFGMTEDQANYVKDRLLDWYENGPDPLLLPEGCKVHPIGDQWEHKVVIFRLLDEEIREHERDGWQVAALYGNAVVFKRPAIGVSDAQGS